MTTFEETNFAMSTYLLAFMVSDYKYGSNAGDDFLKIYAPVSTTISIISKTKSNKLYLLGRQTRLDKICLRFCTKIIRIS